MKERPILFGAPMVRAILAGTKTQTRRIVKLCDANRRVLEEDIGRPARIYWQGGTDGIGGIVRQDSMGAASVPMRCPYGAPGDRLWVKEAHRIIQLPNEEILVYRASCDDDSFLYSDPVEISIEQLKVHKWRPSIHMRRSWSRITLEVTGVRVERLHAITEDDARAEGVSFGDVYNGVSVTPRAAFYELWTKINGLESWTENPWVWVVEFKRVDAVQLADVQRDELESA